MQDITSRIEVAMSMDNVAWRSLLADAQFEIIRLRKELLDTKIDANRYRYLRNNTSIMIFGDNPTWKTSHKLDMSVDEEMALSN